MCFQVRSVCGSDEIYSSILSKLSKEDRAFIEISTNNQIIEKERECEKTMMEREKTMTEREKTMMELDKELQIFQVNYELLKKQ
jgi:hypothetical protein